MRKDDKNKDKPIPYVPYDAKVNVDNIPMDAPETEYEDDRAECQENDILKIIIK